MRSFRRSAEVPPVIRLEKSKRRAKKQVYHHRAGVPEHPPLCADSIWLEGERCAVGCACVISDRFLAFRVVPMIAVELSRSSHRSHRVSKRRRRMSTDSTVKHGQDRRFDAAMFRQNVTTVTDPARIRLVADGLVSVLQHDDVATKQVVLSWHGRRRSMLLTSPGRRPRRFQWLPQSQTAKCAKTSSANIALCIRSCVPFTTCWAATSTRATNSWRYCSICAKRWKFISRTRSFTDSSAR